jgi:hypothetical protein
MIDESAREREREEDRVKGLRREKEKEKEREREGGRERCSLQTTSFVLAPKDVISPNMPTSRAIGQGRPA